MIQINPKIPVKIEAIETQAFNHIRNMIDQLHKVGLFSKTDHKKFIKVYDIWMLKYGLKYEGK